MPDAQTDVPRNAGTRPFLRSRRFWITLIGVLAAALFGTWFRAKYLADRELAALTEQGLPISEGDLNSFNGVPDDVEDLTEKWMNAIDPVWTAGDDEQSDELPIIGDGPTPIPLPGDEWPQLTAARAYLSELDDEYQTVRQVAAIEGQVRFPVNFVPGTPTYLHLPFAQRSRRVAKLLVLDAHVCAHDGNSERALQDIKAIFSCAETLRREPTLISQMVRIANHNLGLYAAVRLMPHCHWNDTQLNSLQTALCAADFRVGLRTGYYGERAMCLTRLENRTLAPFRRTNQIAALRFFQSHIDSLLEPWPVILSRHSELSVQIAGIRQSMLKRIQLSGFTQQVPYLEGGAIGIALAVARKRCANAIIAAERYRLRYGQWPASLAEIENELFGQCHDPAHRITDPFDGEPLRYMHEHTQITIYSIGRNRQDDGGDCRVDGDDAPLDAGFSLTN
jgi:hypothetical protein